MGLFKDKITGKEIMTNILHTFETKTYLGRNIVLVETGKELQLAYIEENDKLELIDDINELSESCREKIETAQRDCVVDRNIETRIRIYSKKIAELKSEMTKTAELLYPYENEMERIEELEKVQASEKAEIIKALKEKGIDDEDLELYKEAIEEIYGNLNKAKNLKKHKEKLEKDLEDISYNEKKNRMALDKFALTRTREKLDYQTKDLDEKYKELSYLNDKTSALLQIMQCTQNINRRKQQADNNTKLSSEQLQILNRYEALKGKLLASTFKAKQYEDLLSNGVKLSLVERKKYDILNNKIIKLEDEVDQIERTKKDLIKNSIYSDEGMCDLLVFDKSCREAAAFIEKEATRRGQILNKKEQRNQAQKNYRDIQRKNIEANDTEMFEENIKETSLKKIIKKENSKLGKLKKKFKNTKVYNKIANSKLAESEFLLAAKEFITERKVNIGDFKAFGHEIDDFYKNTTDYYNNKRNGL